MKILIVEDEPRLRVILEDVFRSGHEVRAFPSGRRALDVLRTWQPAVLISDLGLPEVTGEGLALAAAGLPRPARVVLISAEPERLEMARPLAHVVLTKPFDLRELIGAVERPLLDGRAAKEER